VYNSEQIQTFNSSSNPEEVTAQLAHVSLVSRM